VTLEATGRELDPDFDMAGEAAPFLRAAVLARRGPAVLAKRGWRALTAALLGLPLFGLLGFLCAAAGSLWLLYSIWRSGRGE